MNKINTHDSGTWFKLDNAAKIFPAQNSSTWSNSFRVGLELDRVIDSEKLTTALKRILPRFPCYNVRIRRGFFWFYLEPNKNEPTVRPDIKNPLYRVKFKENNKFLFRIYYRNRRIYADIYHALTDGHGGMVFLSTLAAEYLRLDGERVPPGGFVLDPGERVKKTETEDAFLKYSDSKVRYKGRKPSSYHPAGEKMPRHTFNITSGFMSAAEIKELARGRGVSVTEYISAVMLSVLIKKQAAEEKKKKEIGIQIPIDLRRVFASDTLRNFVICLRVGVNPAKGDYSFDELCEIVRHQLRLQTNRNELNSMITGNTGIEKNPFIRISPLFIKTLAIGIGFALTAEHSTSSLVTNLGLCDFPPELERHIASAFFMPVPGKVNAARLGIVTAGDRMCVTFANSFVPADIEREFFTFFVKQGVHVKIESNRY